MPVKRFGWLTGSLKVDKVAGSILFMSDRASNQKEKENKEVRKRRKRKQG
jgi:hypothetical protein